MTFDAVPGGLAHAILFRAVGTYTGPVMVEAYRAIAEVTEGDILNVLGDTRAAEAFLDTASYETASRLLVDSGIRFLNVVLCDRDPGRAFVARFGNAVSRIQGLEVETQVVPTMAEAVAALAAMAARTRRP
ncbi:hypothetical protein ACFOGJ_29300 [Marinibaculum pumilum]|uniref:Uncharacterized protein n=1 Tax=Marinibaculum pumilum TaxID=1766165 RepID=A0ABV7LA31_9PROT